MILYSENESKLFNLKFGRYEGVLYQPELLREHILKGQFDFVRLKILNPGDELFVLLNRTDFPFHLLDIHRIYTLDLHNYEVPAPVHPEIEFIDCDSSHSEQMKQIIVDSYMGAPMGYFRNELIEKYFPLDLQIENFASYIANNYVEQGNPGKHGWLIRMNGEYIGCTATEFMNLDSHTPYLGLLPEFRKKNLFTDVARFLQRTMKAGGCKNAIGSARLHNIASQINMERENQKYNSHDYVFMIDARKQIV